MLSIKWVSINHLSMSSSLTLACINLLQCTLLQLSYILYMSSNVKSLSSISSCSPSSPVPPSSSIHHDFHPFEVLFQDTEGGKVSMWQRGQPLCIIQPFQQSTRSLVIWADHIRSLPNALSQHRSWWLEVTLSWQCSLLVNYIKNWCDSLLLPWRIPGLIDGLIVLYISIVRAHAIKPQFLYNIFHEFPGGEVRVSPWFLDVKGLTNNFLSALKLLNTLSVVQV